MFGSGIQAQGVWVFAFGDHLWDFRKTSPEPTRRPLLHRGFVKIAGCVV